MVWYFVACLVGIIFGAIMTRIFSFCHTTCGTLKIDRTNPEKDVYRFDVGSNFENLHTKKRVIFKVDPNADFSQE